MSHSAILKRLQGQIPLIAPSLLKCDFGNMHREFALLEEAAAPLLHLDVMDGHFVPNLSYGAPVIERLRELTQLPFDVHLMISNPAALLDDFLRAGCQCVTFHIEAESNPLPLLKRIHDAGAAAGLALNPGTPVESIEPFIAELDLVLVMSVEPGFGGQQFLPSALDKLRRLREITPNEMLISVDGGIGPATIEQVAKAGANVFVVGSAVFGTGDYRQAITELRELAVGQMPFSSLEQCPQ